MFALSSENRFHLYSQPTDMLKSFDGLSGLVQNILERNPCNGNVFIFINKRRDKIKLLHWQGAAGQTHEKKITGFWIAIAERFSGLCYSSTVF